MDSYVLTLYDEAGNPIPIPAIQGVGIKDIRLREEGETADVYEIVLDDERTYTFAVKHGKTHSTGINFETGNALELINGILNVKTTDVAEADNTLPITSSGVHTIVGNIGAILDTI